VNPIDRAPARPSPCFDEAARAGLRLPWAGGNEMTLATLVNEGTIDRAIRVVAGLVLLSLTVLGPKTPWGLVGIVPLLTGLTGFCPLYRLLGMRTCPAPAGGAAPKS